MNTFKNDVIQEEKIDKPDKKKSINWTLIGIIVTVLISIPPLYISVLKHKTIIGIELRDEILLTKPISIEGLEANYIYNDTIEVENLWRTTYILRNIGDKPIYGKGFSEKSIRNDFIKIKVDSCQRLISVQIIKQNAGATLVDDSQLYIEQWRPDEYIEISILADGKNSPRLTINERDIADGEVRYSKYSLDNELTGKLISEYLSNHYIQLGVVVIYIIIIVVFLAYLLTKIRLRRMKREYFEYLKRTNRNNRLD